MKKYSVLLASLFLLAFVAIIASKVFATVSVTDNVLICHATDSQSNPYTNPTVDPDSIITVPNGHDTHNGGVWYSGIADHSWGDIIPPFGYCPSDNSLYGSFETGKTCFKKITGQDKFAFPLFYSGKNWTSQGQLIWNNSCSTIFATATPTSQPTSTPNNPTATPTSQPTVTPTATPTEKPCEDRDCDNETPIPTPTTTPTSTETPNGDICANIDGIQTSLPEGSHIDASGKNCVWFGVPGVPESQDTGIGGTVLGASTGRVLGVSSMAGTGALEDSIFYSMFTLGSLLSSLGIMKNGKKIKKA